MNKPVVCPHCKKHGTDSRHHLRLCKRRKQYKRKYGLPQDK